MMTIGSLDRCDAGGKTIVSNRGKYAPLAEEEKHSQLAQDDWDEEAAMNLFPYGEEILGLVIKFIEGLASK